jgi:poly(3-hydroxyalkanoate) synthetase
MKSPIDLMESWPECLMRSFTDSAEIQAKLLAASLDQAKVAQTYWAGMLKYFRDFMAPSALALASLGAREKEKLTETSSWENFNDFLALCEFNLLVAEAGLKNGFETMSEYYLRQVKEVFSAWLNTVCRWEGEDIADFMARRARLMDLLVYEYPQAIRDIEPEYGFHFDDGRYVKAAETGRFTLYQVLPRDQNIQVRQDGKPLLLLPPFVLGANIMAFLPDENKSFVHCFASQGIPTYIRIVKNIADTPAVQVMTGEEDCLDTKAFCAKIAKRHGRPVTLAGYCQGGFTAAVNYLSGELDGLVDALITCVAPMDGTRSPGLVEFLNIVPERFQDMGYATKTLQSGNEVVDGKLMSWVFKLKSMDKENPISVFYRDLELLEKGKKISKTAAAINYWLLYDVTDLPVDITRMSFISYTTPVSKDGTLPVKLFGRSLNFKRIKEKGIPWLICCAEGDDLVEKEAAVAPLDYVEAEVTIFPKGHAAMATSWSLPTSECSLDSCFLDYRGPVRFHLDLEESQKPPAVKTPSAETARLEPSVVKTSTVEKPEAKKPAAKPKKAAKPRKPAKSKQPAKSAGRKTSSRKTK